MAKASFPIPRSKGQPRDKSRKNQRLGFDGLFGADDRAVDRQHAADCLFAELLRGGDRRHDCGRRRHFHAGSGFRCGDRSCHR